MVVLCIEAFKSIELSCYTNGTLFSEAELESEAQPQAAVQA